LIRREALSVGPNGVAADAASPSWWVAVLDQENLTTGGGDLEAEALQFRIEDDLIFISRCERIHGTLGELEAGRGQPWWIR
jgi:hypothetical protein